MRKILLRDVPEQLVVTEARTVGQAELQEWLPQAMSRVANAAVKSGGIADTWSLPYLERGDRSPEPVLTVVYDGNPNEAPTLVEVHAVVNPPPSETLDGIQRAPAHREAYLRLTRAEAEPPHIGTAYETLEAWIAEQGLTPAGPPREVYWTDFFAAALNDEVCDVAWPVV
jgi:hypothetical protein